MIKIRRYGLAVLKVILQTLQLVMKQIQPLQSEF